MRHLFPIDLSEPPTDVLIGSGDLAERHREWAQPPDRWKLIYYVHRNVAAVNTTSITVSPNTVVFFPPGARGSHQRVTEDSTFCYYATFAIPGRSAHRAALPMVVPDAGRFLPDLARAAERSATSVQPAIAFIWNLCWSVAMNPLHLRSVSQLTQAESYIEDHLGHAFRIRDVADACGLSQRQLLRAFRERHGVTIQEYVRRKRVEEAVRILTTTHEPIKAVAHRVGIRDSQQFNKLIRNVTGRSPTVLRELARFR